ncbi:MAG TPA: hypothetical protein V6C85_14220 [Allocoleopsis sp.]
MVRICEIVEQAINTGFLDVQAEEKLRQLLSAKYDGDDLKFFMKLQLAAMNGDVKLESHEKRRLLRTQSLACSRGEFRHTHRNSPPASHGYATA